MKVGIDISHPEVAEEWDHSKNKISVSKITFGSDKKFWWKCKKCKSNWHARVDYRTKRNSGCPYCAGQKVNHTNCLSSTHPHLIKEWDYTKNEIIPENISYGSTREVWWKCEFGHSFKMSPNKRTAEKLEYNCPYCSNQRVCKDNCLATTHPKLAKEWSTKNKLTPSEVTAGSDRTVLWKCKKCKYEWKNVVKKRKIGQGCPRCSESKGEKEVARHLKKMGIRFKREYKFAELGQKRFDFALFNRYAREPWAVVEYHGEQHYRAVDFSNRNKARAKKNFQDIKNRDKIKKNYCHQNDIEYLEISYLKFDDIADILGDFCQK